MDIVMIVQVAVFRGEGLLVSSRGDVWCLPSGELELGESIEDGAARILFRDTGVIGHKFSVYTSRCAQSSEERRLTVSVQGEYLFCGEQDPSWEWHPWTSVPSPKTAELEALLKLYWSDLSRDHMEEPEIETELCFGDARRDHQRIELSAFITAEGSSIQLASKSHNVSRGGLFLMTDAALTPGQELQLSITLPSQRVIQCVGRVKWRRPSYLATRYQPAGVGIEFVAPQKHVVEAINDAISRYQNVSFRDKFPTITGEYGALQKAPKQISKR